MSIDQFMVWRFRNIEGVLDNIKSWNLDSCVFKDGSKITYHMKEDYLTIERGLSKTVLKIAECTLEKMISLGFKERYDNRHSLSFKPKEEKVV